MKVSRKVYEVLLLLYPLELRQRFGADMADVFAGQLEEARGSVRASALVWWEACSELMTVALPGTAKSPAFVVPLASLAGTSAIYVSLSWALENPLRLNSIYQTLLRSL